MSTDDERPSNSNNINSSLARTLTVKRMNLAAPTNNNSASENSIKPKSNKSFSQKFVNRVKSWNKSDKDSFPSKANETRTDDKSATFADEDKPLAAKDSIEYLKKAYQRPSPKSSPALASTSRRTTFPWDPFDRQSRRNRKDSKKKRGKKDKRESSACEAVQGCGKSAVEGGVSRVDEECCSYKSYFVPRKSKSVAFANEVTVVYFIGCDVIEETREILKKEMEQQKCNEKMRNAQMLKSQEKYNLCLF